MKGRQHLLLFVIVVGVFLISSVFLGANESFRKSDELIQLEKIKEEYESKGQKIPEEILKKIEFETEYCKISTKDIERCEQEVKEMEAMRAKAPKDEERKSSYLFPLQVNLCPTHPKNLLLTQRKTLELLKIKNML